MTEATAHNHTSIHARVASRQSKTGWQGADLRVERVDAASPVSLMAALLMVSQLLLKNVNECVWRIHRISWFLFDWKRFVLQRGQLKVGGMGGQGKDWVLKPQGRGPAAHGACCPWPHPAPALSWAQTLGLAQQWADETPLSDLRGHRGSCQLPSLSGSSRVQPGPHLQEDPGPSCLKQEQARPHPPCLAQSCGQAPELWAGFPQDARPSVPVSKASSAVRPLHLGSRGIRTPLEAWLPKALGLVGPDCRAWPAGCSLRSSSCLGRKPPRAPQLEETPEIGKHWRRKWQPTPVFLPGESQGRGSLVGGYLWGRTEPDMTKAT